MLENDWWDVLAIVRLPTAATMLANGHAANGTSASATSLLQNFLAVQARRAQLYRQFDASFRQLIDENADAQYR